MEQPKIYQNLTIDFETYYDSEYSLQLMPTAQYVHDERFLIHGMGYKFEDGEAHYLDNMTDIRNFLDGIDWSATRLIGHNLLFDGYILKVVFGYVPAIYTDTASMARQVLPYLKSHSLFNTSKYLGLGTKDLGALPKVKGKRELDPEEAQALGVYCCGDCDLTWGIYDRLFGFIPEQEFELMSMTTRMFTCPQFEVDTQLLKDFIKDLEKERKELVKLSGLSLTTLRSTAKLVEVLQAKGVDIPTKPSPSNESETIYTFEKDHPDVVELTLHEDPSVRNIVTARLNVMSSIQLNRAKRFLAVAKATGGDFPVPLLFNAAHTGRWGGGDKLNCQNLPRGPRRECLMAPEHYVVFAPDLGQIEARITAWLADHFILLEKFADPTADVYAEFAADYYNRSLKEIMDLGKKSKERFVGKTCILGLGFGMGWKKLRQEFLTKHAHMGIQLSKEEAYRAVQLYRTKNAPIKMFWDFLNYTVIPRMASAEQGVEYGYKCLQYGRDYIRLPSGRSLIYPNLHAIESEWEDGTPKIEWVYTHKEAETKLYGGKLTENLAQALARDINAGFMLQIDKKYPIATMTHDENVMVIHKGQIEQAQKEILELMTVPPVWASDLPLAAEGGYNERYTE